MQAIEEKAHRLLSAVYHNPESVDIVATAAPHWPTRATEEVFRGIQATMKGGAIDLPKLQAGLSDSGRQLLGNIQQNAYLDDIETLRLGHKPGALESWADDLREHGQRLRIVDGLRKATRELDAGAGLDDTKADILSLLTSHSAPRGGLQHISEHVASAEAQLDEWKEGTDTAMLQTGIWRFDKKIGGIPIGELSMMAAVSGAGKTSFLLQIVTQVARRFLKSGEPRAVALFSIEMSARQCLQRIASSIAKINLMDLRKGECTDEEVQRYRDTLREVGKMPLYVDDDAYPTIDQIRQRVATLQTQYDVALIGVDYDEKVQVRERSEELRVSRIAKGLKVLAKENSAACLALSQYNSGPEEEARRGTDSDLRYSRKKHHESAVIMHWHWPQYFVDKGVHQSRVDGFDPSQPNRGILAVTKNRFGRIGEIGLKFEPEYTRFTDPRDPEIQRTPEVQRTNGAAVPSINHTPF